MKRFYLLLSLLPICVLAQSTNFTHLDLQVRFEAQEGRVHGLVTHTFTASPETDSIFLNGINMEYHQVRLNGKAVPHAHNTQGIWLLPEVLDTINNLSISYSCSPRRGIFFVGWNDVTGRARKQIWTQGQGIEHRHWIPHKDDQNDKVTLSLHVNAENSLMVVANGVLGEKTAQGDSAIWHYITAQPMSTYLIAIVVGDYALQESHSSSGIHLSQFYYPERAADYPIYYAHNEAIFNFLEETVGIPYPWENYKQVPVVNFQHGAMENTSATIFGDFFMADSISLTDRNYPYVNAHELAHHWFGNLVTATESKHHWLQEGFATYYQWLAEEHVFGTPHFDWQRKLAADQIAAAALQDSFPLMHPKAGSARFYQKGAWVLYMMQQQCPEFSTAIQTYLGKHAFRNVETRDWLAALEEEGCNLNAFSHFWIENPHEASYLVKEVKHTSKRLDILLRERSVGANPHHPSIQLVYKNGTEQEIALDTGLTSIPLLPDLWYWNFNPNMQQLAQVDETKEADSWMAQYAHASQASYKHGLLNRYEAIQNLNAGEARSFLLRVLNEKQEFYAVRALAAQKLLAHNYARYIAKVRNVLLENSNDPVYEVQQNIPLKKELLSLINDQSESTLEVLEALSFAGSYDLREQIMFKRLQLKQPEANRWLYDVRYAQEPGIQGENVYISSLGLRVLLFKDTLALQAVIDRTTPAYDFLTRINAIECMQVLNHCEASMLPAYFEALFNTNRKLLRTARTALQTLYKQEANRVLIEAYIEEQQAHWTDFQKNMAARTFNP
jgi:aminopeptidase N